MKQPFWKTKTLSEMSDEEWESLCDGCGKCCCLRMEDEETGAIYVTDLHCKLFDTGSCRCKDYENRKTYVPDCVQLTPKKAETLNWMPQTCAYRLIANGQDLYDWHYLLSGSRETIHEAGMSVQNQTVSELSIPPNRHAMHIVVWPGEPDITPKGES